MPVMSRLRLLAVALLLSPGALMAADDADLRARMALVRQMARESNDRELIATAERLARTGRGQGEDGETALRDLERRVGIDPGGWKVDGLPLFRPQPGDETPASRLEAAMAAQDPQAIAAAVAAWRTQLGDRAGLPDARRHGWRPPAGADGVPPSLDRVLGECTASSPTRRCLLERRPMPNTMVRVYAGLVDALIGIRTVAAARRPEALAELDRLLAGATGILLDLQRPEGHWPFPDLRAVNVRFGAMIDSEIAATGNRTADGWLIDPVRNGGTYFDTGLAGQALLRAGAVLGRAELSAAGRRAAAWCATGALSTNWNYNAFAAGLCADAARLGGGAELLAAAVRFADLGILPGQLSEGANRGRWLDPHNARSVYHAIILRGLHDVLAAMPAGHPRRPAIATAARLAVAAVADEQQAAGVTVICLRELARHAGLVADADPRLPLILAGQRAAAASRLSGGAGPGIALDESAWWLAAGLTGSAPR